MKKFITVFMAVAIALAMIGCNNTEIIPYDGLLGYQSANNTATNTGNGVITPVIGEDTAENMTMQRIYTLEELQAVGTQEMFVSNKYDENKFLRPFFNNQIQYNEGFFLLKNEDGTIDDVNLLCEPLKVLEVRSNDLTVLYEENKDYIITSESKLSFPLGSAINAVERADFYNGNVWFSETTSGRVGVTNNVSVMHKGRYVVTYISKTAYEGNKVNSKAESLTTFSQKIASKENINMLVVGDSIAAGAGIKDFDNWAIQTAHGLQYYTDSIVNYYNGAIPGIHTSEYLVLMKEQEMVDLGERAAVTGTISDTEKVAATAMNNGAIAKWNIINQNLEQADVILLGIGGNDSGGWVSGANNTGLSPTNYKNNVKKMIDYFRGINPDCSIVTVSTMQTNPKLWNAATGGNKLFGNNPSGTENLLSAYANELENLEFEYDNLVCANVNNVEKSILEVKNIEDMLGDNINHPSDYMTRIYAQTILTTVLGSY